MDIAATGFVSSEAGSIASANALLLKGLLGRGHHVDFFSKPSFVDPRPVVGDRANFRFHDCTNRKADSLRRSVQQVPVLGFLAGRLDTATYNQLLLRKMAQANAARERRYDVVLWMGDYAYGSVHGVPSVSFGQGAPGTDARSVLRRKKEIRALAGRSRALRLEMLARLRLSPLGLPELRYSDHIIVGSNQSKRTLVDFYKIPDQRISTMPYPVDLELFRPPAVSACGAEQTLRVLWLGRIVPRKRLDLFLDGGAEAIKRGANLSLTVVGGVGFVPGYERLLREFPFPDRLEVLKGVSRKNVPDLMVRHDVLCQPSEEEDFGSSVAEAQACGLRVIVGRTNGNSDYLSARDWQLTDDNVEALATVLSRAASDLVNQDESARCVSREFAKTTFGCELVVRRLEGTLLAAAREAS